MDKDDSNVNSGDIYIQAGTLSNDEDMDLINNNNELNMEKVEKDEPRKNGKIKHVSMKTMKTNQNFGEKHVSTNHGILTYPLKGKKKKKGKKEKKTYDDDYSIFTESWDDFTAWDINSNVSDPMKGEGPFKQKVKIQFKMRNTKFSKKGNFGINVLKNPGIVQKKERGGLFHSRQDFLEDLTRCFKQYFIWGSHHS